MQRIKRIISLCIVLLIMAMAISTVSAAPAMDPQRSGSITVQLRHNGSPVSGGSIALYRVASLNARLEYTPEPEFAACGVDLNAPFTAAMIRALAQHAADHAEAAALVRVGTDGCAAFPDLKPGLFLLVQEDAAEGYDPINPFVVAIPMVADGVCCYDVDATPKTAIKPVPTAPTDPTAPANPDLPQTGQHNRPIPILFCTGLILIFTGSVLCFGRRRPERKA